MHPTRNADRGDIGQGLPVLALNSGSSSLKFGLYRAALQRMEMLVSGEAESIGAGVGKFHAQYAGAAAPVCEAVTMPSQREAIARVGRLLAASELPAPVVIGHRIVHGGPALRQHCRIDAAVLRELEAAIPFAPLHTPAALAVIAFAEEHFPGVPQVACFDTAFHAGMPDVARVLPIPAPLQAEGIERYGFHGLSCESIVQQLGNDVPERLIIAHLGNGASITAVKRGKSIDTSMGLTPSGGIIMGTRSGDLDPGVLIYLLREKNLGAAELETLIDHHSGLLGISGLSGDMRVLGEAAAGSAKARLAIDMFCYCAAKQIAAMIAALDGLDLLVFTGGIGENDAAVRAAIGERLGWIGVRLDPARNRAASDPISASQSRCRVRVMVTQEDDEIARHAAALCAAPAGAPARRSSPA